MARNCVFLHQTLLMNCILRQHPTHVETVVLLSKGMIDSRKVKVDFSLEDMDLSAFKGKATYEQIKAYILEHTGLKVSSLYIAQIKKISSIVC